MSGNHVEYHGDDILNWGESTSSFVCRTIVLKEHITSEWGRIHCWLCQRIDNETVAREHQSCWLVDWNLFYVMLLPLPEMMVHCYLHVQRDSNQQSPYRCLNDKTPVARLRRHPLIGLGMFRVKRCKCRCHPMRSLIVCSNETTWDSDRTTAGIGSTNLSNLGSIALGRRSMLGPSTSGSRCSCTILSLSIVGWHTHTQF